MNTRFLASAGDNSAFTVSGKSVNLYRQKGPDTDENYLLHFGNRFLSYRATTECAKNS
jgi:hypothetical protein